MVPGWVCPELAAILTRLRAAGRFESMILMALLSRSPFPRFLTFSHLGSFPQITMLHVIPAAHKRPCANYKVFTVPTTTG